MPLRYETRWFTPAMCQAEPDALFVFGDNCERVGMGGQAVIRREPNAIGIVTKLRPTMSATAFFTDADFDDVRGLVAIKFYRLRQHLEAGGTVVWPADGIGTGRAQLPERAPRIWAALERARLRLDAIAAAASESPHPPSDTLEIVGERRG